MKIKELLCGHCQKPMLHSVGELDRTKGTGPILIYVVCACIGCKNITYSHIAEVIFNTLIPFDHETYP